VNELVVCSLEAWDDVWRRNQFLVAGLRRRNPGLRVLFVEPPLDPLVERRIAFPQLRAAGDGLWTFRPLKPGPRRLGGWVDAALRLQVRGVARRLGLRRPTLWVNDTTYARLAAATGWPMVYDVTDDWLLARAAPRERARRERLEHEALRLAREVVVCSPALAATRGRSRPVTLIPNGVDTAHLRRPRPRPADLPPSPVAVYAGTLHDERLDVELVACVARVVAVALVGPDALSSASRGRLAAAGVRLLGPRPYDDLPAYLQHADVLIVPHLVTPFTESLDPIKAYECVAVGRPTVATPVAGFRGLGDPVITAPRDHFAAAVEAALAPGGHPASPAAVPSWDERSAAFEAVLRRVAADARPRHRDRVASHARDRRRSGDAGRP
jgi:teichuronic acid biosynthesis glycosyltransferase TuaH